MNLHAFLQCEETYFPKRRLMIVSNHKPSPLPLNWKTRIRSGQQFTWKTFWEQYAAERYDVIVMLRYGDDVKSDLKLAFRYLDSLGKLYCKTIPPHIDTALLCSAVHANGFDLYHVHSQLGLLEAGKYEV